MPAGDSYCPTHGFMFCGCSSSSVTFKRVFCLQLDGLNRFCDLSFGHAGEHDFIGAVTVEYTSKYQLKENTLARALNEGQE